MLAWECPAGQEPNWYGACVPMGPGATERLLASGATTPLVGLTPRESCPDGYALSPVDGQCHTAMTQEEKNRAAWGGDWRSALAYPVAGTPLPEPPPGTVYWQTPDGTVVTVSTSGLATPPTSPILTQPPVCASFRQFNPTTHACEFSPAAKFTAIAAACVAAYLLLT